MNNKAIIIVWGCLDLCSVGWYLTSRLLNGQVPFYHDIVKSVESSTAFGIPSLGMLSGFSSLLHVSLIFSGYYLIRQKRIGAILSYIQTPFRIFAIIPPSIFFLTWPLKFFISNPRAISSIVVFFAIVLLSETVKTTSVFMWHRKNSLHNQEDAPDLKPVR